MTGPGAGKIRMDAMVFLENDQVACNVYVHLKGYSRAKVTHLDVEGFNISAKRRLVPSVIVGGPNGITIIPSEPIIVEGRHIRKIKIIGLKILNAGEKSGAYLGIKDGGFFVGLKRELMEKLEEIAKGSMPAQLIEAD
ncbi:MAG: hypothetical protein NDP24_06305 [Crenarchaeota archaeon]|nr:hypothetical protein [Thermoproteota archaeon]MCR8471326.1 hypothetical protein [Thermoproteota archaeon]MCR8472468.1 hypothetical protein [Thermoproteota archaeon]MCR8473460.1 hypothetical protein [Thermoproteota archaeon]